LQKGGLRLVWFSEIGGFVVAHARSVNFSGLRRKQKAFLSLMSAVWVKYGTAFERGDMGGLANRRTPFPVRVDSDALAPGRFNHQPLSENSSITRSFAGCFRFFALIQCFDRPA
jgi:hypothetical protein